MTAQSGRLYRLYVSDGGSPETWRLVAGMREKSQSHSAETIDQSGTEQDGYQHLLPDGRRSVSLSGSGVAKDNAALSMLKAAVETASIVRLRAELDLGDETEEIIADFHIGSFEQTGPYQDAVTFSASFQSAGPYSWHNVDTLETYDGTTVELLETNDGSSIDTLATRESLTED